MTNQLNWGILGTGNIARQFANGVASCRSGRIVSVASRAEGTARAFAQAHGIPTIHADYAALLGDPQVDAIYVSLPNSMHHQWTIAALRAGKHVLCEKPLAANLHQGREMFDEAQRNGRLLVEAFMYRSHPLMLAVIEQIRGGAIGELRMVRSSFCYRTMRIDGNIRFDAGLAGGALMDVGCYCINLSRLAARLAGAGEPRALHAAGKIHPSGVDEISAGTMYFENHVLASFTCGMSVQADNTAYLCGSEGYIEIPIPWKPPQRSAAYTIARSTPPKMDAPAPPGGKAPAPPPPRQSFCVDAEIELYGLEADDFAAAVLDGQPPRITCEDSLGNMAVLDEMRKQLGMKV